MNPQKYLIDNNICKFCKFELEHNLNSVHQCLIFTNGIPNKGNNHMKKVFEILKEITNPEAK